MNGLHRQQKRAERQRRDARRERLNRHRERPQLQRNNAPNQRCRDDLAARKPLAGERAPKQRPHKTTVERHIPDVGTQRHQAAVGKQQALNQQHADHRQKRGVRPHDGGQQHAAAQVAAGPGAGNCKIDHLGGKNERAHHAHHGHGLIVGLLVQLVNGTACGNCRTGVHDPGNPRGQQCVCHVHN